MQDRIPHVNEAPRRDGQMIWAFWLAAALAASAGVLPFAFGGTTSRVAVVAIPFGVAALALGACALLRDAGRTITSGLYFVAGLAIVYGLLSMFSLPLQQAIGRTCAVPARPCGRGVQRPLTGAEDTGVGCGAGLPVGSLLLGSFRL